jgi:LAO/AO transport system kinase
MTRVLSACGWNRVILETVGSGQSEVRIVAFADRVLLIDGPDRGDVIQAEKAGILELADAIAINKADLPNAQFAADAVREAMGMGGSSDVKIHLVSAIEGTGIPELISDLDSFEPKSSRNTLRIRERLIASWDSTLLSHPNTESYLEKIGDGSITVDEAIGDIMCSLTGDGEEP